ncbi:MAG: HAMP domain-containing protein [Oscillospiraceae bacterium]|jgi:signal transduction histidine kinase|nr:HAMP domain-containing protein [Oscillospiraceae bacterium]
MKFRLGLHGKFVLVLLSFGLSFGAVFFVFLMRGSVNAYQNEFFRQVHDVFAKPDFSESLIAASEVSAERVNEVIANWTGPLGIDNNNRIYYILDGRYGQPLAAMNEVPSSVKITRNILAALNEREGSVTLINEPYMDIAVRVGNYIVYIFDNKAVVRSQSAQTGQILLQSVIAALIISLFLSFVISKQIVSPLQKLSKVAIDLTSGIFPDPVDVSGSDETAMLTERFNDMLEHLRLSEQMRREFVANVSHELRTPITNVRSYAETLVETGDTIELETRRNFLNVILNESDRMTKLVQDLLILSKIDAGEIAIQTTKFNLSDSVKNVFDANAFDATKRGLKMKLNLSPEPIPVLADKDRIEQVLINIISNSVRYTSASGSITVSSGVDATANEAWFSIVDTGIGIPKDDIPQRFDRFYRVDKARSRAKGGTGLGLSIAHEIIEQHGGSIEIRSEVNIGTTVIVRLPIMAPDKNINV